MKIMMNPGFLEIPDQASAIETEGIPVLAYDDFYDQVSEYLKDEANHCLAYFPVESDHTINLYCIIAGDTTGVIRIYSYQLEKSNPSVKSLTPLCRQLHIFEREIHEKCGVEFSGHPWMKPVRYPYDRFYGTDTIETYPFYEIESEELHEVGVGPIHAGVIEPGHFRFICNGEKVLHLEIQLGYQHRGIEQLIIKKSKPVRRAVLSESIAGDSAIAHSLAYSQLTESLAGIEVSESLQLERCIALEMERIALHTGDTAALCGDVAYQLGQVVCESVRTTIINAVQFWCGNRFGKGLVRPGGTNYPLTAEVVSHILKVIDEAEKRFGEICDRVYSLPSLLSRFEEIGEVTRQQALITGAVGMAARSCGLKRDIRVTHPFQYYRSFPVNTCLLDTGDVLARAELRMLEVIESIRIIRNLCLLSEQSKPESKRPLYDIRLLPGRLAVSVVEGWRGEICHSALTDRSGNILNYKIKDPSFHNWFALALAVRNQEISDFPVCNKSFNLSYCGNDL